MKITEEKTRDTGKIRQKIGLGLLAVLIVLMALILYVVLEQDDVPSNGNQNINWEEEKSVIVDSATNPRLGYNYHNIKIFPLLLLQA